MATELAHQSDYSPLIIAPGSLLYSIPGRLTVILAVLLVLAQMLPAAKFFANPAHYLPLHIVLEFFAITISGMVAGLAWNLRERQPNSHRMILGAGFLAVCWIDVGHALSYAGMPFFVTASGPEKAINFWLAGRLVAAATLLAIALTEPRHWSPTLCRIAIATALGLIGVVGWVGLFHADWLPRTFIAGQGLTPFKVNFEYFLAAACGITGLLFYRQARRSGNPDWLWLAAAAWIQGLAEMFFTLYADVTDLFNLLGHVYKAVAYIMVYRALFVSGVLAPYRELDAERDRLRESEQHFRTLANNGSALIWTSGTDKLCNYFNEPWLRYSGRTIEQELGYGWSQGIHPDDFDATIVAYTTHFDRRMPFIIEYRLRRADGSFGWVRDEGTPRFDSHGNFIGYIGFCYDISSIKAAEYELAQHRDRLEQLVLDRTRELSTQNQTLEETLVRLRQAQSELVQASKLSSLGKLVAGVAHELNTPIGNARTVATALCDNSAEFSQKLETAAGIRKSELIEFLHQVDDGSHLVENNLIRAANLIQSFKQVAVDRSSSQRRVFDLRGVTDEIIATLHPAIEMTPFVVDIAIDPEIRLDSYPGPYGHVIVSLIENALIHGLHDRAQGRITVSGRQVGDVAEIEVCDDGWGIAPVNLPQVFDPFFTTRFGQGGNGLGLNIVFNIVTGLLGGKISVDSPIGRGACFLIAIPLRAPERLDEPIDQTF